MLDALHALGTSIAIDDFGTRYSSLADLRQLPVDALEIDSGFVRDLVDDPGSRAIVRPIIDLCDALSLAAVAKGVETEHLLAAFADVGCTRAQGYLVAPALPVTHFEDMVRIAIATQRPTRAIRH